MIPFQFSKDSKNKNNCIYGSRHFEKYKYGKKIERITKKIIIHSGIVKSHITNINVKMNTQRILMMFISFKVLSLL